MDLPVLAVVFSVILALFGAFANFLIFILVLLPSSSNQLNSPTRVILLHLSIVCFSLSILYLWILIYNSIISSTSSSSKLTDIATVLEVTSTSALLSKYYLQQENHKCSLIDLFIQILQPISLWTVSCIHFDRYYAICSPLRYNTLFTTKKVSLFLATGWIMMMVIMVPNVLMSTVDCQMIRACWFHRIDRFEIIIINLQQYSFWRKVHLLFSTIITIFLPILLITVCNFKILTIANYQRHKIANAIFEATLSAQVAITHQKNPFALSFFYQSNPNTLERRSKSQKATFVVFELIIIVVILYFPYYTFLIWFSFYVNAQSVNFWKNGDRLKHLNIAIFTVQFILLLSPTINACLYGLNNKNIKNSLKNIWRKQKTKIDLLHEIQNRTPSTCGSRRPSWTENSNIPNTVPLNLFYNQEKPILKRQISDLYFRTSSLTSHNICDDLTSFHTNKMRRTPSDSLILKYHDWQQHNSPNLSPRNKSSNMVITSNVSKTDLKYEGCKRGDFPQILVTKHCENISNEQKIRIMNSGNQKVVIIDNYEKEPLLTQTLSLNDFTKSLQKNTKSIQTF
ncbi:unnamed protein product [Diamesa serratosioi]